MQHCIIHVDQNLFVHSISLFDLWFYIPVNNYCHIDTVS